VTYRFKTLVMIVALVLPLNASWAGTTPEDIPQVFNTSSCEEDEVVDSNDPYAMAEGRTRMKVELMPSGNRQALLTAWYTIARACEEQVRTNPCKIGCAIEYFTKYSKARGVRRAGRHEAQQRLRRLSRLKRMGVLIVTSGLPSTGMFFNGDIPEDSQLELTAYANGRWVVYLPCRKHVIKFHDGKGVVPTYLVRSFGPGDVIETSWPELPRPDPNPAPIIIRNTPPPPPPSAADPPIHWRMWVGLGTSLAAATATGVAIHEHNQAQSHTKKWRNGEGSNHQQEAKSHNDRHTAAVVSAGVLAAVSIGLFSWEIFDDQQESPTVTVTPAGAGLEARF
jgi:hypothetical protein